MNKWMTLGLAAAIAVALTSVACARQSSEVTPLPVTASKLGGIEGTVTGPQGKPVAGMRLGIVSGTAAFPEIGPETDQKGYYYIGAVPPGTFQVAVHDRDGSRVGLESVAVRSGETATLDFSLSVGASAEKQASLPPLPVMRLRYAGRVYDGVQGSYCWPVARTDEGQLQNICADKVSWEALEASIPVDAGDTVTIEIEAEEPPEALSAGFFEIDSDAGIDFPALGRGSEISFAVDVPSGVYNVQVSGQWAVGQMAYEFRLKVNDDVTTPREPVGVRVECEVTLELALENPMLVARGVDPIPSGFDAVNSAGCNFGTPVRLVTLELHRGGSKMFAQEIGLDPAVAIAQLPLSASAVGAIPADLEPGSYDRVIKVTGVDGVVKQVGSGLDPIWVLDPTSSPTAQAREALISARRMLLDSLTVRYPHPIVTSFEPMEWRDAGLGCPRPGMMYAQVITPGFRLVFEHQGERHEYHTNQDGSTVVKCETKSASGSTNPAQGGVGGERPAMILDGTVVAANTEFGFNLFSELAAQNPAENVFISPLSVAMALAMTYNGAAGETQEAMALALRVGELELGELNGANAALLQMLDGLNPDIEINIANSLWARQGVDFSADFLERNREFYRAQVTSLDFADPGAVDTINGWVDESTNGKIDSILDRINPNHVLFLINAIYFNGTWLFPFNEANTTERTFHLDDGSDKQLPMMSQSGKFQYLKGEGFQALKLPYQKPQVGMYVFLPDPDSDLDEFLENLTAENWGTWHQQFEEGQGDVMLPRFKLEYEANLNDALTALGMGVAFGGGADFSAMGPGDLFIDSVIHKAVVEVNEVGTEAAAVTAVIMAESMAAFKFDFVVDRPFFFALRDDRTGTVLFMGAVYEPQE